MRRQIPLLALAIGAGLTLGLANLAQAAAQPFGSRTPAQILSLTRIAMERSRSVHVVNRTSLNGSISFALTTDSSTSRGTQTQVFGAGVEKVRLIGSTLFINANSAAFSLDFNVSNSTLTNEWVRVPASNPNYANISAAILLPSLIKDTLSMKSTAERRWRSRAFHPTPRRERQRCRPSTSPRLRPTFPSVSPRSSSKA